MKTRNQFYQFITQWLLPLGYTEILPTANAKLKYLFIKDDIVVLCVYSIKLKHYFKLYCSTESNAVPYNMTSESYMLPDKCNKLDELLLSMKEQIQIY